MPGRALVNYNDDAAGRYDINKPQQHDDDPGRTHYFGDGCDDEHGRVRDYDIESHRDHLIDHPYDGRYFYDPRCYFIVAKRTDNATGTNDDAGGQRHDDTRADNDAWWKHHGARGR